MALTKTVQSHVVNRITLHVSLPASVVLKRLYSSIASNSLNGLEITKHTTSARAFEAATNEYLGIHGFMHFATIDHTAWIHLYGVHEAKSLTRVVFGNPQIAITMLEHDVRAGLFAPVEALVIDRGEGNGTDIVYVQPSQLVVGAEENPRLSEAASKLDAKLEALWKWVSEPSSCTV